MVADGTTKALVSHHRGEFQHQNCTVGTVHDSDHEGVVRILNELFTYITRHNCSPTRSVIIRLISPIPFMYVWHSNSMYENSMKAIS